LYDARSSALIIHNAANTRTGRDVRCRDLPDPAFTQFCPLFFRSSGTFVD